MLELIILGQVPGTNFQITFAWAVFLGGLFIIGLEHRVLGRLLQPQPRSWNTAKLALTGLEHMLSVSRASQMVEPSIEINRNDTLAV